MNYTKEDILVNLQYAYESYVIAVPSKLFNRNVVVTIRSTSRDPNRDITEEIVECLCMFAKTNKSLIREIKNETFENYKAVISNTSYGFVPDELVDKHHGDETKANQEYFGYKNGSDALNACRLKGIYISDGPYEEKPLYYTLGFDTPWDEEHGITFCIRDNAILSVE